MAVVRPLSALKYDFSQFPDASVLLAPPYDVIKGDLQNKLYEKSPYNVIRLEYGIQNDTDTDADNRYTRAKSALDNWLAEGILQIDESPAFYMHRQKFEWDGEEIIRTGFFAAVELQPFEAGIILPHEYTLKGPKVDRLKLMDTCGASFSPGFGLYDGRNTGINEIMAEIFETEPIACAEGNGFSDCLWRVDDAAICEKISTALINRQILIADGHHRYETTLALRDQLRERYPNAPKNASFNYTMMALVDINDPGLLVLPTHRMMLNDEKLSSAFDCLTCNGFDLEKQNISDPDEVTDILAERSDAHAFIIYQKGEYTLITAPQTELNGLPVLDVTTLQNRIISPMLSAISADATVESHVRYTIHPREAVAQVDSGEMSVAIFLNPTPVEDVLRLAAAGIRLPQKSTYFFPKLPTGLIMYSLRPDVTVG